VNCSSALDWRLTGGNYESIRSRLARLDALEERFAPRARRASRDLPQLSREQLQAATAGARSLADVLRTLGWPATAGAYRRLRQRLAEEGIDVLAYPGQAWRAGRTDLARIPIDQMLVNGDRRDNRLENLRLLCPNCHAQTPTYLGRNIGRIDLLVTALGS
jgi:hypothetical protein